MGAAFSRWRKKSKVGVQEAYTMRAARAAQIAARASQDAGRDAGKAAENAENEAHIARIDKTLQNRSSGLSKIKRRVAAEIRAQLRLGEKPDEERAKQNVLRDLARDKRQKGRESEPDPLPHRFTDNGRKEAAAKAEQQARARRASVHQARQPEPTVLHLSFT